ncbi:hypothetical protein CFC21_062650 [Triticum aestivum]|uniref:Uncharacterized protein n=3 Tax=Triticinae TaxID=1648030 RepID=A0A3B6JKN0_WHEAT|nr:uncharacterized protein LOC109762291 [Aegilops tauschii subsp. strangulata]XP_044376276.1 uncharacterized protein LOC123098371 [Triticum aestivum]KAF7055076.1 hypothetical protein CFC21_062650 [Triticum aestivum]
MGGGGGSSGSPTASSSSDDDGDASWRAAIDSVAVGGFGYPSSNGAAKAASGGGGGVEEDSNGLEQPPQDEKKAQTPGLKLYQIKVRNMLDDMLEKNLEIVRNPCLNLADPEETGGGIKLFKKAPPGIRMDAVDKYHVQLKRPKILPGPEVDEKSKKFRHMLQSVVVDGNDVLVSAKEASQISLARMEARETAAKTKAKREEERVNQLKKVRGEKWLPSIASKMKKEKSWEQWQEKKLKSNGSNGGSFQLGRIC